MKIRDYVSDDGTVLLMFKYVSEKFGTVESVKITYLTGKVEEAVSKPNVSSSTGKMITKLLSGIIIEVNGKPVTESQQNAVEELVRSMYVPDRDLLMQAHYMYSFSDEVEIEGECKECRAKNVFTALISETEVTEPNEGETHERTVELTNGLRVGDVLVKQAIVRNVSGVIQEAVLMNVNTQLTVKNELLNRVIKTLVGLEGFPSRIISDMTTKDRNAIMKSLETFSGKVPTSFKSVCKDCGGEVVGTIGLGKYFEGE